MEVFNEMNKVLFELNKRFEMKYKISMPHIGFDGEETYIGYRTALHALNAPDKEGVSGRRIIEREYDEERLANVEELVDTFACIYRNKENMDTLMQVIKDVDMEEVE